MQLSQDIGFVRRELVRRAMSAQPTRPAAGRPARADSRHLRELLDEAHTRIRTLETAIERLTAAL